MYPRGKNEYLVSDPRLTVSEAAACRRIVAAAPGVWKADAEKQKPVRHLVADICEPFGLGEVYAENDIAVIKPKRSGECRGILGRESMIVVGQNTEHGRALIEQGYKPDSDGFIRQRSVYGFTHSQLDAGGLYFWTSNGGHIRIDADGVTIGGDRQAQTEPTSPQPTEAELLAAELARPPRGVSVEQWRAYVAMGSECRDGRRRGPIDASALIFWRAEP